jgi:fructose-bisphosphate aldolase class 1
MDALRIGQAVIGGFDWGARTANIRFTRTLKSGMQGQTVPQFLSAKHRIASFLKIDAGLEQTIKGVQLMKAIPNLTQTLTWARSLGIIGTKMRSLIHATTEQMPWNATDGNMTAVLV